MTTLRALAGKVRAREIGAHELVARSLRRIETLDADLGAVVALRSEALAEARLLGHRCHNPLCQRISPDHVVVSSAAQNRREWSVQRRLPYSPLADPRGPRRRARELRDLAREDPQLVADDLARLQELLGEQLTLW